MSDGVVGNRPALVWAVNISALLLVVLWTIPTFGILVSSLRDGDQLAVNGWWTALTSSKRNLPAQRAADPATAVQEGDKWVVSGNLFEGEGGVASNFGISSQEPQAYEAGETVQTRNAGALTVNADGSYRIEYDAKPESARAQRIFVTGTEPPRFTFDNYRTVLFANGLAGSFINTLTVTIPATIIPILIAAYAAYALAWMEFPGRALLLAIVVGLLVVPLQMSLIPILQFYTGIGLGKSYIGIWLAHTGFGL
ncbi:carbohydrate ABC transporter permease, partial [Rhizobiaceae bacterium]|nr:carbohydrate ABC transporter permease [Rhizobiaceae bacterium]